MKSFVFSLERMRNYKDQVLTKEKGVLTRLRARRDEIEREIDQITQYRESASREFTRKQRDGVSAFDLSSHSFMMENTRRQIEQLKLDLQQAEQAAERQMQVVLAASQEVSSLDKLEEKKLDEYHYLQNKDAELEISELINADMTRRAQSAQG